MITLYCMSRGVQARFTQVEFVWVNCYLPSSARGRRFDQGSEPGHHPTNHQSQSQRLKRDWSLGDIGEVFGNIVSTCILGKSGVESCREIWWPQPALGRPKGRRLLWLKWCCNNSNVVLNTWGDIKLLLLIFWKTLNINFCDQNSERLLTNLDLIYTLAPSSSIFKEYWLKNKPTWSIQFKLGLMKSFKGSSVSLNRTWKVQLFFGLSGISLYICMWLFYWWKLIRRPMRKQDKHYDQSFKIVMSGQFCNVSMRWVGGAAWSHLCYFVFPGHLGEVCLGHVT